MGASLSLAFVVAQEERVVIRAPHKRERAILANFICELVVVDIFEIGFLGLISFKVDHENGKLLIVKLNKN